MLHLHDLDHMQIDGISPRVKASRFRSRGEGLDGEDCVHDICGKFLSEDGMKFG